MSSRKKSSCLVVGSPLARLEGNLSSFCSCSSFWAGSFDYLPISEWKGFLLFLTLVFFLCFPILVNPYLLFQKCLGAVHGVWNHSCLILPVLFSHCPQSSPLYAVFYWKPLFLCSHKKFPLDHICGMPLQSWCLCYACFL